MVQISWLASAQEDLREIYEYIALDSPRYAERQIERIYRRTDILKTQATIGKPVPEIGDTNIRELLEGNYRIVYRILDSENIHILMVHHSTRDMTQRI